MSSRSVKPLRRYVDFSIFQDGGRRHVGFLKCRNFTIRTVKRVKMPHGANIRGNRSNLAEIWRFFNYFKTAAVRHLGSAMHVFGPPMNGIWWSLSLRKIWLESIPYFGCYASFNILGLRLETTIHAPHLGFWGFDSLNGQQSHREPKRHFLARKHVI